LGAVGRRGIAAVAAAVVAGTVLCRDYAWRWRRGRWTGTPASLEDRQRPLRLLDHTEDAVEHYMDVLPLVVKAAAVLGLQSVADRLLWLLSQMMRCGERVYLINLHETGWHGTRPMAMAVRVTLNRSTRGVQRVVPAIRIRRLLLLLLLLLLRLLLLLMMMAPRIDRSLAIDRYVVQKGTVLVVPEMKMRCRFNERKRESLLS